MQPTADDEWGYSKPKRRVSTGVPKNRGISTRSPKQRRASSPGPRKSAPKRLPSAGDSQLDADGETDPDVVEVEDELMQVSAGDAEEATTGTRYPATASGILNGSKEVSFDDLEHFYSGNPIDIDHNTDEQAVIQKPEAGPRPQSPSSANSLPHDNGAPDSQDPVSPVVSSYDPLFDSPSHSSDKVPEIQGDPNLPHHRARAAKPLVKLIDTMTLESTSKQSPITAKARLMSLHTTDVPSTSGPSGNIAKRSGKPGPGRSSSGLITNNRSSLLAVTKGALKSVMGKFASTMERNQPDEIEEVSVVDGASERDKLLVTSWSDEDVVDQDHQTRSNLQPGPPPSGDELLKLAGLKTDPEPLPDYEDDPREQPQEAEETQISNVASAPAEEESPNESLVKVTDEFKASDRVAYISASVSETGQQASIGVIGNPSISSVVAPPVDEAVKKK